MIPNKIILTYKNNNIPEYVFNNIKHLNPDKEILFFDDEGVRNFLLKEYGSTYLEFFNSLTLGCTKGDFFRYCYLYKYGGYYCDIDIFHTIPIKEYIATKTEFFSVNSQAKNTTFQALLFCEAWHPIIKNCLEDIVKPESSLDLYHNTTADMYKNIKNYLNLPETIVPGDYNVGDSILGIGEELSFKGAWTCFYKNKQIALSRYPNWLKLNGGTNKETGMFI